MTYDFEPHAASDRFLLFCHVDYPAPLPKMFEPFVEADFVTGLLGQAGGLEGLTGLLLSQAAQLSIDHWQKLSSACSSARPITFRR